MTLWMAALQIVVYGATAHVLVGVFRGVHRMKGTAQ